MADIRYMIPGRPPTPSDGRPQCYMRKGRRDEQRIRFFANGTSLTFGENDIVHFSHEQSPFYEQILFIVQAYSTVIAAHHTYWTVEMKHRHICESRERMRDFLWTSHLATVHCIDTTYSLSNVYNSYNRSNIPGLAHPCYAPENRGPYNTGYGAHMNHFESCHPGELRRLAHDVQDSYFCAMPCVPDLHLQTEGMEVQEHDAGTPSLANSPADSVNEECDEMEELDSEKQKEANHMKIYLNYVDLAQDKSKFAIDRDDAFLPKGTYVAIKNDSSKFILVSKKAGATSLQYVKVVDVPEHLLSLSNQFAFDNYDMYTKVAFWPQFEEQYRWTWSPEPRTRGQSQQDFDPYNEYRSVQGSSSDADAGEELEDVEDIRRATPPFHQFEVYRVEDMIKMGFIAYDNEGERSVTAAWDRLENAKAGHSREGKEPAQVVGLETNENGESSKAVLNIEGNSNGEPTAEEMTCEKFPDYDESLLSDTFPEEGSGSAPASDAGDGGLSARGAGRVRSCSVHLPHATSSSLDSDESHTCAQS